MVNKFNHLNVPDQWNHYWSRYPQGYTIMESLIAWVSQVDSMVDNQNKLNGNVEQFRKEIDEFVGRFDEFVGRFDERLQTEVTQTLSDWQNSGFLDVVISSALQWQLDDYITTNEQDKLSLTAQLADYITTNEQDKLSLTAQLADKAKKETYGNFEIKSVNVTGGRGDFTSARATTLLNLIVSSGFNSVTVVPTWYMTLNTDNVMFSHPTKTPTDTELITFISAAKALGLHVMLKPHVDCLDGTFRGAIRPTNFTTWFENYNTMITGYATMCHTMGVDIFIIGTELKTSTLDPHTTNWLSIIANIRAIYSNKITYATLAGLVDPNEIKFWTSLDYIGANDWIALTEKADYTSYDVENAWYNAKNVGNIIEKAYNQYFKYGKKILITEVGCNKYDLSLSNPSKYKDMCSMGAINLDVPKDFAIAFYKVARKYTDMFIGYSWWCLDLVNPTNTFSFEDKPELQAVMSENNNDDEFVNKSPNSMMSDVFKFIDTFRLGTTSLSGIGDGLVKGAIKDIHDRFADDVGAVDANTLKTSGFYYTHGTTNVKYPFGFLIVVGDGTRAVQLNFHNQLTLGFVYRVNDGTNWSGWMFANCSISNTAERPTAIRPGYQHFDSTLGKPIWRNNNNTAWVDATGATV